MSNSMIESIKRLEERLRKAMISSNVDELDILLSPELIFTNHLGQKITKQQDLLAHREKLFTIKNLTLKQLEILPAENVFIVIAQVELVSEAGGLEVTTPLRFTRVWCLNHALKEALDPLLGKDQRARSENGWQVIAGHSSVIC
ncbi:nuclear transport factor 2 family protein [Saccharophagus degradans]|uniref:nuclear transport factor 2 family protein n=1 Tax=Saccharophagus degradans TaxID=86304 RepID=UPI000A00D6B1|nr:nuclear transport factor 2 family protein [Saccharophagus degradans]